MLVDTHCHINFKEFKSDADEIIEKSLGQNTHLLVVGAEYKSSLRALEYAKKYKEGVWAVVGLHPTHLRVKNEKRKVKNEKQENKKIKANGKKLSVVKFAVTDLKTKNEKLNKVECSKIRLARTKSRMEERELFDYEKYLELAMNKKTVAIGEVGLDYHHFDDLIGNDIDFQDKKEIVKQHIAKQKEVLRKFMRMSKEVSKPLVFHCWGADKKDKELVGGANAYNDLLEIITEENGKGDKLSGVVHSFIGNYRVAEKFVSLGFKIGLNGIITYSESYDKLIKEVGLENIVLETDAPYLTPAPLERYSRNEPANVKYVAQKISDVLGIEITEVEKVTTFNAKKLFGI